MLRRTVLLILILASCATGGSVKSGLSALYEPGLTVTLVSWLDGRAEYAGSQAEGRWLTVDLRVDYDGNAPYAEVPAFDFEGEVGGPRMAPSESPPPCGSTIRLRGQGAPSGGKPCASGFPTASR